MLALVSVATVAGLAAAFLQLSTSVARRQVQMRDRMRAFYVAEAALSEAWTAVQLRKTGAVGSEADPAKFGDGLFWVESTETGNLIRLESTAMVATGTAKLSIVVSKGETTVANLGVHSGGNLDLPAGTLLDAYDSRLGYTDEGAVSGQRLVDIDALLEEFSEQVEEPVAEEPARGGSALYATISPSADLLGEVVEVIEGTVEAVVGSDEPEFQGRLGSGGSIWVSGTEERPTIIDGTITPGTNGNLTQNGNVTITGSTDSALAEVQLPDVDVPSLPSLEGVTHTGSDPLLVLPVQASLPNLTIGRGAEVIIEGPATIVLESLVMEAGSTLTVDTGGGPVSIFVTSSALMSPTSSLANSSQDPTNLNFQISAEPAEAINLPGGVPIYGMVYAPGASLRMPEGFELFGSIAAGRLAFSGPPKLHFDQYLDEYANELAKPTLLSWRIVELGNDSSSGGNPFVRLGVNPTALRQPADAHAPQPIEIDYLDSLGNPASFSGSEAAFDWTNVKSVVNLERDGETVVRAGDALGSANATDASIIDALVDQVDALKNNPTELLTMLLRESPLPATTLHKILYLDPAMPSADLRQVFMANAPTRPNILYQLCNVPVVTPQHVTDILVANSPGLTRETLTAAQLILSPAQFSTVTAAQ